MFYTKVYKKHSKLLFPRVSDTDPMGVTAGAPAGPDSHWEIRHGACLPACLPALRRDAIQPRLRSARPTG